MNYNSLPTTEQANIDKLYDVIRKLDPELYLIKVALQEYKLNPAIKISEITEKLGVSDSVIRRVRRENNLTHLGYLHLIGNNNQKAKGKERQIEVIYQKL